MRPPPDPLDPKGLLREAYAIEGITAAECRSILLDWALSLGGTADPRPEIAAFLDRGPPPDHPMTQTLRDGLAPPPKPGRRGGRAGRLRSG